MKPHTTAHRDDALTALLETEHALHARATAAAAEAERIVADAMARAIADEHENQATIARELAQFESTHARAVAAELAAIAERARLDGERFASVTDARVSELAALVVERVMRG
jgi:hypothetical protein